MTTNAEAPLPSLLDTNHARLILDKLPAGAYLCDAGGLIVYYNRRAAELWGREPKLNDPEDRYCGSFKLFSAEGMPLRHDECWMALALQDGQDFHGQEIQIERPDGSRLSVLAHASPLRDDEGRIRGALNVLVDIGDRSHVLQTQALLAAVVESSDDAIVAKNLEGRILSWNAGAQRMFGYTPEEAVGKSITCIVPSDKLHEEDMILAKLRRGERIEHYETVRRRKDGELIDVSVTISPIRDASGQVVAASKVGRDITARKRSQERLVSLNNQLSTQLADLQRLHDMSRRLSTTLELRPMLSEIVATAAAVGGTEKGLLALCDPDSNHVELGASLGFDDAFLKQAELASPGGACGAAFREGRRVIVEDTETDPLFAPYRELARQAGFRSVHSTPLITRAGKIIGVLTTYHAQPGCPTERQIRLVDLCARQAVDFVENARLYARLREHDRRKDEFLATLAHELRNPLAPLSNSLQLLRMANEMSPTVEQLHGIMERQVKHITRLVDDLLEVSRITRGKTKLRLEQVGLAAVLANAVESSRPAIEAGEHQLAITLPAESMTIHGDPVRLAQVVMNLLSNAAKYMNPGGQIWLSARSEEEQAVISVRDMGMGIPPEMIDDIFDMFAQVDHSVQRSQGGLGIGLTLAKSFVEMHGGRIEVHSGGLGKGSEFIVRLPLVSQLKPEPIAPSVESSAAQLRAHHILIVDDSEAAAFTLAKLLEKMGQRVTTAFSALAALEILQSMRPDVIISDIGMPGIDGYELARRIRADSQFQDVVLVALTGYGQDHDRQLARQAGFSQHLIKPASMALLQQFLAELPRPAAAASTTATA